jgi:hypothetical protein
MTKKMFVLIALLAVAFIANVHPAIAQGGPDDIYVDPSRADGNEDGTQTFPYNSVDEGKAYAQSLPNGGYVYVKDAKNNWIKTYVPPVVSGSTGTPIPNFTLYVLLGVLALVLILAGWYFLRRSRQIQV